SEPTRMPTRGVDSGTSEVSTIAGARERDPFRSAIRELAGAHQIRPEARHVQDAAAVRHELTVALRRSRMEDKRAECLGVLDARDRRARVTALGILAGGDDHG